MLLAGSAASVRGAGGPDAVHPRLACSSDWLMMYEPMRYRAWSTPPPWPVRSRRKRAAAMAPARVAPPVRSPTEPGCGGGGPPSAGVCTKADPDRHHDDG